MLPIKHLEEIQALLLRVPALVHEFEEQSLTFVAEVKSWLSEMEQVLARGRLPAAAEVALLRGALIGAERGSVPAELRFNRKLSPRKLKLVAGAELLRRAERAVFAAISSDLAQKTEAERVIQQIVTVLKRRDVVLTSSASVSRATMVEALWHELAADESLGVAAARVESIVGLQDALLLLERYVRAPIGPPGEG